MSAPWTRKDTLLIALVAAVAIVIRAFYTDHLRMSPYDPWRHLLLVRNLREGAGFTLFAGQPYLWYQPPWYWLCALFPRAVSPQWIAAFLSAAAAPLAYLFLRRDRNEGGRLAAATAGALFAAYGPLIQYTCHVGSEAFALFLTLLALVVWGIRPGIASGSASGLLLGTALVARLNFAFNFFLLLPWKLNRRIAVRLVPIAAGIALPLALAWWRNHRIIGQYPWVFTWDGLATPSAGFNFLSTLVVQMHPDVREGLTRLHHLLQPEITWSLQRPILEILKGPLPFTLLASACVLVWRRPGALVAWGTGLFYYLALDPTGSTRFPRIWLALFPVMLLAVGVVAGRLARRWPGPRGAALGVLPAAAVLLLGALQIRPPGFFPLEMVTPPPALLTGDRYMVSSTFFHPESLIYRFPGKNFIGMPLHPEEFEAFHRSFPRYRDVIWHDFGVQPDLRRYLLGPGGYEVSRTMENAEGRTYTLMTPARPQR